MVDGVGYRRVSKKRPCSICGKPDWCSTTAFETISFCARSTSNADRISRYGWGVYYSQASRSAIYFDPGRAPTRFPRRKTTIPKPLASPAIRDRVYRKLIELSPATSSRSLISGRGGLLERGIQNLSLYGNLPRLANERQVLVDRLADAMAKENVNCFRGIPGFWSDAAGGLRLWSERDAFDDLMLIPFVGPDGRIRACQIRFMRHVPNRSGRYAWLSSSKEEFGCGAEALLHHADPGSRSDRPLLITEGALKAASAQEFLPGRYVVGNSGVATSHQEIIETAQNKPLEIAFDNDSFTNPHVARALAALVRLRMEDQRRFEYDNDIRIITWDRSVKGIDEALLSGHTLGSLTVAEWLKALRPDCFEQADRQLSPACGEKHAAGGKYDFPARRTLKHSLHPDRTDRRDHRFGEPAK